MHRYTCDGCLNDIDTDHGWIGLDEFIAPSDVDDEDDPVNDDDYAFHYCSAECVWAWASQRILETGD